MPSGSRARKSSRRLRVPDREGEHAAQAADGVAALEGERAQHDRGVARRPEVLAAPHDVVAQLDVVVDLAVEDDHVAGHRVDHRLRPASDRSRMARRRCASITAVAMLHRPEATPRRRRRRVRGGPSRRSSAAARSGCSSLRRPTIPAIPHILWAETTMVLPPSGAPFRVSLAAFLLHPAGAHRALAEDAPLRSRRQTCRERGID